MQGVFLLYKIHIKIIYNKSECGREKLVSPHPWGILEFKVPMYGKPLFEKGAGNDPGLEQPIHSFL